MNAQTKPATYNAGSTMKDYESTTLEKYLVKWYFSDKGDLQKIEETILIPFETPLCVWYKGKEYDVEETKVGLNLVSRQGEDVIYYCNRITK